MLHSSPESITNFLIRGQFSYCVFLSDQADFQWASQLKQRFKGESGHSSDSKLPLATIDILDASFEYGFEFLGNGPRLVITPLTDRIYVTATQVRLGNLLFTKHTDAKQTKWKRDGCAR